MSPPLPPPPGDAAPVARPDHAAAAVPRVPRRYREHDEVVHSYPTRQQRQMAHEWVLLNRDPAMGMLLTRWAGRHPVLAGLRRPADVLDRVDGAGPAERDAILLALIEQFHDGASLAGRIVLQAMLPKLSGYALRHGLGGDPGAATHERFQRVVCDFWEVLCDYPLARRRQRVAANLALDTLHRLTRDARGVEVAYDPAELTSLAETAAASATIPAAAFAPGMAGISIASTEVDADWSLSELLTWAVRHGWLSAQDAALLSTVYSDESRMTGDCAGYQAGVELTGASAVALRQRAHRIKRRLTDAVRAAQQAELAPG